MNLSREDVTNSRSDPLPLLVVGGGFAGLSAAAMLAERGARVLLLEARARLGGRATAFVDRETGEMVDNGQHVLFGCYRETLAFLRRIGADGNVHTQDTLELPFLAADGDQVELAGGEAGQGWPWTNKPDRSCPMEDAFAVNAISSINGVRFDE